MALVYPMRNVHTCVICPFQNSNYYLAQSKRVKGRRETSLLQITDNHQLGTAPPAVVPKLLICTLQQYT